MKKTLIISLLLCTASMHAVTITNYSPFPALLSNFTIDENAETENPGTIQLKKDESCKIDNLLTFQLEIKGKEYILYWNDLYGWEENQTIMIKKKNKFSNEIILICKEGDNVEWETSVKSFSKK
jgi:hypothetical protein